LSRNKVKEDKKMTAISELFVEEDIRDKLEEQLHRPVVVKVPKEWMGIWSETDFPSQGEAMVYDDSDKLIGKVKWTVKFEIAGVQERYITAEPDEVEFIPEPESEPSEPKLEIPVTDLIPVTDFGGNKITLAVRGGLGHDHVHILKDGVPVAYMHIIPGKNYTGGYSVDVFSSDKEFFEAEPSALATPVQKTKQQQPEVLGTITCTYLYCCGLDPTYEITDPKLAQFLDSHDESFKVELPKTMRTKPIHYQRDKKKI
jgi:hypothetical protein